MKQNLKKFFCSYMGNKCEHLAPRAKFGKLFAVHGCEQFPTHDTCLTIFRVHTNTSRCNENFWNFFLASFFKKVWRRFFMFKQFENQYNFSVVNLSQHFCQFKSAHMVLKLHMIL